MKSGLPFYFHQEGIEIFRKQMRRNFYREYEGMLF